MNWRNLKENKCPKCEKDITKGLEVIENPMYKTKMLKHNCGFMIRENVYTKIVNSQITQELEEKLDQEEQGHYE